MLTQTTPGQRVRFVRDFQTCGRTIPAGSTGRIVVAPLLCVQMDGKPEDFRATVTPGEVISTVEISGPGRWFVDPEALEAIG